LEGKPSASSGLRGCNPCRQMAFEPAIGYRHSPWGSKEQKPCRQ
jgi:hypothetical protein